MAEDAPLTRVEKLAVRFAELANEDSRGKWLQTRFLRGVSYVWVRAALANRMPGAYERYFAFWVPTMNIRAEFEVVK